MGLLIDTLGNAAECSIELAAVQDEEEEVSGNANVLPYYMRPQMPALNRGFGGDVERCVLYNIACGISVLFSSCHCNKVPGMI